MGQQIELSQFATITEGSGPSKLERRDKTALCNRTRTKYRGFGWNYCNTMARKTRQARKPTGVELHLGWIKKIKVKVLVHWELPYLQPSY
jgi:hypothetical protein